MNRPQTFSKIEVEASEWLVAMSDRTVSLDECARFEAWLNADPEHERIYRTQKSAWQAVATMPHLQDSPIGKSPPNILRQINFKYAALAASLSIVLLGTVFFTNPLSLFGNTEYETTVAQIKDIKLEDGSLVTLGASSHIDVDFTKTERRIVLTKGEAFFEVTRDTARPFFVTAGDTLVRVVGTKFDVHYGPKAVRVSVLEGRVEVMKAGEKSVITSARKPSAKQVLMAGEAVVADKATDEIATTKSINKEDLGAWRSGRLVYVDARLRDVIADVNRYYDGKIDLADESVGDLQLTTAFRADQIDNMLEVLTNALPIEATRPDDKHIVLTAQPVKTHHFDSP